MPQVKLAVGAFKALGLGAKLAAGSAAVGGIQAIGANKRAKQAARDASKREAEIDQLKEQYANLDTSNPYSNLQNVYEDLTVNQQAARFQRQTAAQSRADILDRLRGSAGASGIASLAQSLANQGSIDAQKVSALIGSQEQANQSTMLGEEARLQGLEREGELISRQARFDILQGQMGLTADQQRNQLEQMHANRFQRQQGINSMISGVSGMAQQGAFDKSYMGYRQRMMDSGVDPRGYSDYQQQKYINTLGDDPTFLKFGGNFSRFLPFSTNLGGVGFGGANTSNMFNMYGNLGNTFGQDND